MAKHIYEIKKTTKISGVLDLDENNEYFVRVEDKDTFKEYPLKEILDSMLGTTVTFSNEETL